MAPSDSAVLSVQQALASLQPEPGLVVLMCGIAGSGKTTFSKALADKGFARLGIDEQVWSQFGRYGLDYRSADYDRHVEAAREAIRDRLADHLSANLPTVVDSSFWRRAHRDRFKDMIETSGRRWALVYLQCPEAVLRTRISQRQGRFDADAARPIPEDLLQAFIRSFEAPSGEGELVVVSGD